MPSESKIRKLAVKELLSQNYISWYPYDSRWAKEQDIFGVFDLAAFSTQDGFDLRFIQITTRHNISERVKKVNKFLFKICKEPKPKEISFEVWGWDNDKKIFKTVEL